ncbi:MAG: tRNA (adenosine(37)-N6)-threonylcarbamoyltransferase complex ATPase subunit type 1 TsaE [Bacteroidales bacterium]|jgi:tRNA threonylcarbamoyladenosine biosynthesis protein TsaE
MKEKEIYKANSTSDLQNIAEALLKKYDDYRIFTFDSEMGSGKTTFISAICEVLKVRDNVSSPTFAIINEYHSDLINQMIYHIDLYRINKPEELINIGFHDYLQSNNYCFIEWSQKGKDFIQGNAISVDIQVNEDGSRYFEF